MKQAILLGSSILGNSDEKLGRILMETFLRVLSEKEVLPEYMLLWNSAVMLATNGYAESEYLNKMCRKGTKILICKTCIDYYNIADKLLIGTISNMPDIQQILLDKDALVL